jgi:hypothetical protein
MRNDGIGGTPRLARYGSFRAADDSAAPTPGRPPLPKRTPGETDPDQDQRFQLAGSRGVVPAPYGGARNADAADGTDRTDRTGRSDRSPELSRAIHDANSTARTHIPNRTTGECHRCGGVPGPCRPFLRAIAILDRWEPANARRIRAVLHLSGLMPAGYPHDNTDESAESYGALDDA